MDKITRRAKARAFKERKVAAGVFAVRCAPNIQVWVGATPTLDTIQAQFWFALRLGSSPYRDMQAAWDAHGEAAFSLESLEVYDVLSATLPASAWLKDRASYWRERLSARKL